MGPIIVIIGMLLMIVIHEAGHFLAAKYFDMKATEAFFGFGPKIWSIQRGETEYGVKSIPLGGYVRIIGMNPFEEIAPEEEHRTYRYKPFWQKTVVVLAGIASHFVIGFFLFYALAVTYNTEEPTLEISGIAQVEVTPSGAADEVPLLLESDDTVISVDGVPLADVPTTSSKPANELITVVVERNGTELALETNDRVVATPSYVVGIERGDVLVAIDGIALDDWEHFVELVEARPATEATITLDRDGEIITSSVVLAERIRDGEAQGFVGVGPVQVETDIGPIGGLGVAGSTVGEVTVLSLQGLWTMVANTPDLIGALFGQETTALEEARPVSIIGIARVATGIEVSLFLLAYVNIFVGTLNFIPLYPLDGGHFAVALYEKIRGREADVRPLIPVAAGVFIFILMLGLLGIYFDIVDPIPLPG